LDANRSWNSRKTSLAGFIGPGHFVGPAIEKPSAAWGIRQGAEQAENFF